MYETISSKKDVKIVMKVREEAYDEMRKNKQRIDGEMKNNEE